MHVLIHRVTLFPDPSNDRLLSLGVAFAIDEAAEAMARAHVREAAEKPCHSSCRHRPRDRRRCRPARADRAMPVDDITDTSKLADLDAPGGPSWPGPDAP